METMLGRVQYLLAKMDLPSDWIDRDHPGRPRAGPAPDHRQGGHDEDG